MQADTQNTSTSTKDRIASIKSVFKKFKVTPYCTGTVPLDANVSTIFYRSGDSKAEFIDFAHPTDAELENLVNACEPATFGMNQKDVYDEGYRKARKMDVERFSTQFHPADHGIVEVLSDVLLKGQVDTRSIRMELYKLNVYGPGGFFKAHVDTPRGTAMFGSLVVIFPTVHEGGSLILRQGGEEWTFNSADAVRNSQVDPSLASSPSASVPRAAFIAFFSDVEHEVTTVSSGYRVTLTYNLYRKSSDSPPNPAYTETETQLREGIAQLLKNPSFLPTGGTLGFGLDHKYPINRTSTKLEDVAKCLKGMDEFIKRVCDSLSLKVGLRPVYGEDYDTRRSKYSVVLNGFADFSDMEKDEDVISYLSTLESAQILCRPGKEEAVPSYLREDAAPIQIVWIKELSATNSFSDAYIGFGNQAEIDYIYGEVCLIAYVPPAEERL